MSSGDSGFLSYVNIISVAISPLPGLLCSLYVPVTCVIAYRLIIVPPDISSDSEDAVPPCTHEDIKLPSRINTNDSSSSSQIDSSSDEEDVDIENKNKVEVC